MHHPARNIHPRWVVVKDHTGVSVDTVLEALRILHKRLAFEVGRRCQLLTFIRFSSRIAQTYRKIVI